MTVIAAGKVVVKITSEADTRAFSKMEKQVAMLTEKHWLLVRGIKNVNKGFQEMKPYIISAAKSAKKMTQDFVRLAAANRLVKKLTDQVKKLAKAIKKLGSTAKSKFTPFVNDMMRFAVSNRITAKIAMKLLPVLSRLGGIFGTIKGKLAGMGGSIKTFANGMKSAATGVAQMYAAGIKRLAGPTLSAIKKGAIVAGKAMLVLGGTVLASAYKFGELDRAIEQVGVVAGITEREVMDGMVNSIIKGAGDSIFSMQEMADTMGAIGSMGVFTGEDIEIAETIEGIADTAEKLAVASGFDDMTKSAETLMGAMRTFGYDMDQNADVANLLMAAANESALSMADMGTALQYVGQQSATMGFSLEQTLAALGALRNQNIDAGIASRSLAQAFQSLSNPSEEAGRWMRRLNISLLDSNEQMKDLPTLLGEIAVAFGDDDLFRNPAHRLEVLNEIFGQMGSRAILPLIENLHEASGGFSVMMDAMTTVDPNELTDAFTRMAETGGNQIRKLKNQLMSLGMVIGQAFLEPLMESTDEAPSFFETLNTILTDENFLDAIRTIGKSFATLAKAILPILASVIEKLADPLATLVAFIAELLASEEVQALMNALFTVLENLFEYLKPVLPSIMRAFKTLIKAILPFTPIIDLIAQVFAILLQAIEPVINIIAILLDILDPLMPLFIAIGGMLMKWMVLPMQLVLAVVGELIGAIGDLVGIFDKNLGDALKGVRDNTREIINTLDAAGDQMLNFDWQASQADFSFDSLTADTPAGGGVGAGFSGVSIDEPGSIGHKTTIIIEGDVKDEETIETINNAVADSMLFRRG